MANRARTGDGPRGLSNLPAAALHAELRRRQRRVASLVRRRNRLAASLATLEAQIHRLGGTLNGQVKFGVRRRPKNEMNLVEALRRLLTNKTMSVTDAAEAVQEAGYKTTSSTFRTIVNQTLINSGQFKRVGRGLYTAKG